jgi:hypothetical protein
MGAAIDADCLCYTRNKNGVIVGYVTGEEYEKLLNQ